MIENIRIENFRGLKELEIEKFSRVNLLVGKNNVGKSTVLEAIQLFLSLGSPVTIEEILELRGELAEVNRIQDKEEYPLPVERLFFKRSFTTEEGEDNIIYIGSPHKADNNYIEIQRVYYKKKALTGKQLANLPEEIKRVVMALGNSREELKTKDMTLTGEEYVSIKIECKNLILARPKIAKRFEPRGTLITWLDFEEYDRDKYKSGLSRIQEVTDNAIPPVGYVPTGLLDNNKLVDMWDDIVGYPEEQFVIDTLKLIESDIKKLDFIKDRHVSSHLRVPVISLNNGLRLPLKSSGDGVIRLLQLILALIKAKNGYLLIDEFENGLHYAVQSSVWSIMFSLAKKFNVQLFITTHSWDCVRSFGEIWKKTKENQEDGSFHRLDKIGQFIGTMPYSFSSLNDSIEFGGEPR